MALQLNISDSIVQAIRLPEDRMERELFIELSLALYSHGVLSFGKAREMACLNKYEFGRLLGERGITRHYGNQELEDDVNYGCGQ